MKRRLQHVYWLGVGMTLLMSLIAVSLLVKLKIDDAREDMHSVLGVASAWTLESSEDLQSMADRIASVSPNLRVTFLMEHGLVLADSLGEGPLSVNHIDRPEVIEAFDGGVGESLRISSTQSAVVLYVAKRIAPNLILRLSYPIEEITRLLLMYAVGLSILFVMAYSVQRRALSGIHSAMLRQMDDVRTLLEGENDRAEAVFPEFQPAMDHIAYQAKRLNDDLAEVNRTLNLRNDFVANASHELRSPLTSIMGFAEMLGEGMADTPQEQQLCIDTIRSECARMLEVIEDILLLSRAEKTKPADVKMVDAASIAGDIAQALGPRAAQKEISISVEGALDVQATDQAVWEMLYNLMDNAVHYGKTGGFVRVQLGDGRIVVEDDGIGIDEKHLPHLFEQFYRVDEARSMSSGGSGLGLSIVRALATQLGAQVFVESELGCGSRFTIDFVSREREGV